MDFETCSVMIAPKGHDDLGVLVQQCRSRRRRLIAGAQPDHFGRRFMSRR
jgi:hypothetical protein